MPDPTSSDAAGTGGARSIPDFPLILGQLQDQLDELRGAITAQQTQLDQLATRLAALEHR